jgi:putative thioredoxin
MSNHTLDVTGATFEQDVIERSRSVVVVVDFWAPWCGPCRVLGPVLEQAVGASEGRVELVKINVDDEPELASSFGVQGIPAVKAFRDGEVVAEFVGAQPGHVIEAWLRGLLPSESEEARESARSAAASGDVERAIELLRERVAADGSDYEAVSELARLHGERGETAKALELFASIPAGELAADEAINDVALYEMIERGRTIEDRARLAEDLEGDAVPGPFDSRSEGRFALAGALWLAGEHEQALDALLELLERDRTFRDGAARRALLAGFERIGAGNDAVERARRRMAMILFS